MKHRTRSAERVGGLVQRAMESPLVVSIYESRLWRRSPLVEAAMGIRFERELDLVARSARIENARRVLDLACGSGIYSRPFARRMKSGRLVGLDISRPMLERARRESRREGLGNLDLVRGSALALPFRSGAFEVVNCCAALHLLPDPEQALAEIGRVLAPGGRFTTAVLRAREGAIGRAQGVLRRRLFGLRSFSRAELEAMLERAGLGRFELLHAAGVWMVAAASKPRAGGSRGTRARRKGRSGAAGRDLPGAGL